MWVWGKLGSTLLSLCVSVAGGDTGMSPSLAHALGSGVEGLSDLCGQNVRIYFLSRSFSSYNTEFETRKYRVRDIGIFLIIRIF